MIQADKQKKRQTILISVLIVVAFIAGFVLYSNYKNKPKIEESQESISKIISSFERELGQIKLELDILDNELFKSLKSYGVLPVIPGETGRENPFQSY